MRNKILALSAILLLASCTQTYVVTFSGSTGGTVSDVGGEFDEGTVISVTAQPDTGYEFQGWSDGSAQNPRSITVSESLNLIAKFSKKQFTVNVNILGNGKVTDGNAKEPSIYDFGTTVNLNPIPDQGYFFVGWDISFNSSELPDTVSGEITSLVSQFNEELSRISAINAAINAKLQATELNLASYSSYEEWDFETYSDFTSQLDEFYSYDFNYSISIPILQNITLSAKFEKRSYAMLVSSDLSRGWVKVNSETFIQKLLIGTYNTSFLLAASSTEGWEFTGWTGDIASENNPLTITLDKNLSINAEFIRKKFDLNISIEGEGTVTEEVIVQPSQYDYETQVKLTATAEENWKFIEWSGDIESTDNPLTITIDSAKSITAKFINDSDGDGVTDDVDQCSDTPEGARVDVNGCTIPAIKVHTNGVTIVAEDWAEVGTEYTLNGKTYKIVDRAMLDDMITKGQDLSIAVTSKITNFGRLFYQKTLNNQEVRAWDTSNVTDMSYMLWQSNFNGDISLWDVRKVTNMYTIFFNSAFSGDVSNWKTESLVEMRFAFGNTTVFNSDLNDWDVSKVTDMNSVFANADGFNKPLDRWDVSNVTNMTRMFSSTALFNQDLSSWCVRLIFAEPFQFTTAPTALPDSFRPKWGTCPDGASTDTGSGGDSAGDTSGSISLIRFSEAKACINNICDVTLGMRFSNGTTESITVNKIEVYTNDSLTTTFTSGDALGTYAAGQAKSFSISLDNATSGKVIVYYTASGVSGTKEYNWTNQ